MTRGRAALLAMALAGVAGCQGTGPAPVVERPIRDDPDYAGPQARERAPVQQKTTQAPAPVPGAQAPAPPREQTVRDPDWRPESYVVKKGDTLYDIALDHGLAYRDVAAWNALTDPNFIRVGQTLRLTPPPGWKEEEDAPAVATRPLAPAPALEGKPLDQPAPPATKSGPKGIKVAYSDQALARLRGTGLVADEAAAGRPAGAAAQGEGPSAPKPAAPPARPATPATASTAAPAPSAGSPVAVSEVDGVAWAWPARGRLLHAYNQGANPKGVAIAGEEGQPVVASAPGKIVYAGSGLRGYGKLVIIKHNSTYLSVYAHNRALLVKEGDRVGTGQKIAEMGSTDSDRVGLHFEIRRLGKPVDPLKYLPSEADG